MTHLMAECDSEAGQGCGETASEITGLKNKSATSKVFYHESRCTKRKQDGRHRRRTEIKLPLTCLVLCDPVAAVRLYAGAQDGDGDADVSHRRRLRHALPHRQRLRHAVAGEPDPLHPRHTPAQHPHAVRGLSAAPPVRWYVRRVVISFPFCKD